MVLQHMWHLVTVIVGPGFVSMSPARSRINPRKSPALFQKTVAVCCTLWSGGKELSDVG